MNIEEQIIDMLSGEFSPAEERKLLELLENDPIAQETYNSYKLLNDIADVAPRETKLPSNKLRSNVLDLIKQEKQTNQSPQKKGRVLRLTLLQKAASIAAILIVGLFIGQQYNNNAYRQEINQELAMLRSQIDENITSSSVSTRIKAVNYSKDLPTEDPSILELIISTAENDKNANVRLAAVQALSNHLSAPMVPAAFGRFLMNEDDPAVKIAIIETVSQIKSEDIVQSLESLTQSQDLPQYVKDEAHNSMTILQHGEAF